MRDQNHPASTTRRGRSDSLGRLRPSVIAETSGLCTATIIRLIRTGVLPADRTPGGHYRIRPEVAARFLDTLAAGDA